LLPASVKVSSFGIGKDESREFALVSHQGKPWLAFAQEPLLAVAELKIVGQHNVGNALAALALGKAAGLAWAPMLQALREFPGLRHRCQWVRTLNEVSWFNDSKGTNVGASVAAITGLATTGPVILLAGGVGKGADFAELAPVMAQSGKLAILFGEDADKLTAVLEPVVKVVRAASLEDAVQQARELSERGDVVLLSPACASFDMFNNYEHRGDVFTQTVRELH
jgi:UDP-N-acetylmuramoylalanine--D-glutamate ligase